MEGYEYFVWGENAQEIEYNAPARQFNIDVYNSRRCVTVDKIWQCPGRLLSYWDGKNKIKDVCLSYALYKIIRCQTEEIFIPRECYHKMQNLIFRGILSKEGDRTEDDADADERIFRIFEIETAFLNDYKRTRYPIIIWYGFPVINLIKCLVTSTISIRLATNLHNTDFSLNLNYKDDGSYQKIKVDRKITYVILSTIVLKAFWEIALYIFSDWMKIKVVCKYVLRKCLWRNCLFEHITWYLCTTNLVKRWCKKMPQYNILQRFNYHPYFKRAFYYGSMHITERPMEGAKLLRDIKIYREVKRSIADALRSINSTGEIMEYMRPVYRDHVADEFEWACYQETCSHLILVWHIATSMSEIELYISEQQRRQGTKNCFPLSLSWIKNLFSRKPFLVDLKHLEDNLRSNYISANAISRYCAYLLIFAPDLLPDNKIFPRLIFENTVQDARDALASCNSFDTIYEQLMKMGRSIEEKHEEVMNLSIVQMGARLGYALITKMRSEDRWQMLSRYWANLLLYLAPSPVSCSHENYLQKGGEFITLLWALFTHSGISEREKEDIAAANEEEANGPINVDGTVQIEEIIRARSWRYPSR